MLKVRNAVQLSASDLVGHLNCRNLTELDLAVAKGTLAKPRVWDPLLDVARERGLRHEQGYVEHLRSSGFEVETIAGIEFNQEAVAATAKAMSLGRQVIVQGAFLADNWGGRTDVLLRVETPSSLGDWSYEVVDTKLSRETKGGTVLQLSLYSDLLAKVQGLTPQWFHVIAPWSDISPKPSGLPISPPTIGVSGPASNKPSGWIKPSTFTRTQNRFAMCAAGRNVVTPSVTQMITCL